ncbi:MAG: FecR family protein, partial [Cyanobacteria bacterium P01_A01_bin.40]
MQQFFARNPQYFIDLLQKLTCGLYIAYFASNSASASTVIKQAEIYKTRNQVELNSGQNPDWQEAQPGDVIVPQDSVRTGANSRADILFNEGTLVRTGAGTTFRFPPGKRSFELTSGAALIMIRPEQGQSTINTPEAKVVSQGTALFVQHNPQSNSSLIGVLTNSPAGLVEVSSADGKISLQLQAGQFVSIVQGVVGLVEHFVLPMFYETVELSAGLGMEPEAMEALLSQESS